MKNLLLIGLFALGACSMFQKEEEAGEQKPVPNCVQQTMPKNPAIPCKVGDWYAPEHGLCSSSLAKCQSK